MKVLLDENLDHRLRRPLGDHEIYTVRYMGWDGRKNGDLLDAAERSGFDLLLTGDQTLSYEQNLTGLRLAIVALSTVEWRILQHDLKVILAAVERAVPGSFQSVNCGAFSRKRTSRVD